MIIANELLLSKASCARGKVAGHVDLLCLDKIIGVVERIKPNN